MECKWTSENKQERPTFGIKKSRTANKGDRQNDSSNTRAMNHNDSHM